MERLLEEAHQISADRQDLLDHLANHLAGELQKLQSLELIFICTHNSRRSHLSQIWAATAAAYFGVVGINVFSGGTESTAFHPNALAAVRRAGFEVQSPAGTNPRHLVFYAPDQVPIVCYSKVFSAPENPQYGFTAVMTCSDAAINCPVVPGAAYRFALTYEDPKEADGTPEEVAVYDARTQEIGRELLYLFHKLAKV